MPAAARLVSSRRSGPQVRLPYYLRKDPDPSSCNILGAVYSL